MNDAYDAAGEFSPAETFFSNHEPAATSAADSPQLAETAPNGFAKLGLEAELLRAVEDLGFVEPTPVQQQTIPLALAGDDETGGGNDLMVSSQTGSGKTAAFLLPMLHSLLRQHAKAEADAKAELARLKSEAEARGEPLPKKPRRKNPTDARHFKPAAPGALVLCPTRELAQQVAHDAIDLVKHCRGLRVANVVGGMPYRMQIAKLQNANLVVATPGRLLDLQRSSQIKLDEVQFLVIDEADRMLDLGFADDLAEINQLTLARRQTMMFSATFAPRVQQLAMRVMRDGGASVRKVQIDSPQERHANIRQSLYWADNPQHKRKLLDHWLRDAKIDQAIVFASTQIECDGLAGDLQQAGFSAVALHGALSQGLRNRRLTALRDGHVQILVATDVAARGLDVPSVTHVFNYGLPMKAEDYTHRIGRTGRAGRDGLAVSFAEPRDRRRIADIEAFTRQPLQAEVIAGLEPQLRAPTRGGNSGFGAAKGDRFARGGRDARAGAAHRGGGGSGNAESRQRGFRSDGWAGAPAARSAFDGRQPQGSSQRFGEKAFSAHRDARIERHSHGSAAPARPARPATGGKVFVPRDAGKKRAPARPTR